MTQILTFIEPGCVYIASDRRLTLLDGSTHDDHTNKCVIYDGRVAFAFTGLAQLDGKPVHEWLTTVLAEGPTGELKGAADHVAERATESVRRLRRVPARAREVTFVAAGWARLPDGPHGIRLRISNRSTTGGLEAKLATEVELFRPGHAPATAIAVAGRALPPGERDRLLAVLRHCRRHGSDPDAISAAMVASIRRSASRDSTIGKRVLTAVLPRAAALSPTGMVLVGHPTSSSTVTSFRYWEDGLWNGIIYGPSAAFPHGAAMTNFQGGPILPELAGMIDRGESGFTVRYPIAVLRTPEGGLACVSRSDGASALIAYADGDLMSKAIHGPCRGAMPIPIANVLELDAVLDDLSDPVDGVLLDPDPVTMVPREFLTVEQIHERRREREATPAR